MKREYVFPSDIVRMMDFKACGLTNTTQFLVLIRGEHDLGSSSANGWWSRECWTDEWCAWGNTFISIVGPDKAEVTLEPAAERG